VTQQDFSNFKISWPNPPETEGHLTFFVRDLDQCVARSAQGSEQLCTQFNQPHIVDRRVEVPYKVAKGILGKTQDDHDLWEVLAGCLVTAAVGAADIDSSTGAVINGVVQGVFGKESSCYKSSSY
jgi:hypothetical protein